jgi:hypothetical protein
MTKAKIKYVIEFFNPNYEVWVRTFNTQASGVYASRAVAQKTADKQHKLSSYFHLKYRVVKE